MIHPGVIMHMRVSRKRHNRPSLQQYYKKVMLVARNAARSETVKSLATIILVAGLATASFYMGMWIERGRVTAPQSQAVERTTEPPVTERSENTPKTQTAKPKTAPAPVPKDVAPAKPKAGAATPGTTGAGSGTTAGAARTTGTTAVTQPVMAVPVVGEKVFGYDWMYSPSFGDWRFHTGMDVKSDAGTPVKAALNGTVLSVKEDPTNGLTIVLDHGGGLVTVYGGLDGVCVDEGAKVVKSQIIGLVGEPPLVEADLGPHLHFEVRRDGKPEDPAGYFPK